MGLLTFVARSSSLGLGAALLACTDEPEVDLSRIDRPRVIALIASPAEAQPGESVTLSALVAGPDGTELDPELDWSLCLARRPLAELGPVAQACLDADADAGMDVEALLELGRGASVVATLPDDACRRFGPEPPASEPGQPTGRPVDPDPTGGYYQPIAARSSEGELSFAGVRLECGLAGATAAQASEYATRHQRNVAPRVSDLGLRAGGSVVAAGERVSLRASWPACPREPSCGDAICSLDEQQTCSDDCTHLAGCEGAETHVYFDPLALELATRREAIGVTWYASAGTLDEARTGRASDDERSSSDNTWVAPDEPGLVHVWVVLRDDRGGVGVGELVLEVE